MTRLAPGGYAPASGTTTDPSRKCRCGTILSRYNPEDECGPCELAAIERAVRFEQSEGQRHRREARNRTVMRNKLKDWDVPHPGCDDPAHPESIRLVVFHYARTGDAYKTAKRCPGISEREARAILSRQAAQEMIESMVEEGTWPEGAPTGV